MRLGHSEKYGLRCEVARSLKAQGYNLDKIGNIFYVKKEGVAGSLFHSHNLIEIKFWMEGRHIPVVPKWSLQECDSRTVALKYGRTIRL